MRTGTTPWHQEWVIDPDPLAVAQARHLPSGFGVTLKTIGAISVPPGERPFVAAIYTDDSRAFIDQLFRDLGNRGCRAWMEEKQAQARELWRALGLDLDPAAVLPEPAPCEVSCWRDQWTVHRLEALGCVHFTHGSGWAVRFVYAEAGADGGMGWCGTVPDASASQLATAERVLGDAKVSRLGQEAEILLMEEGFFHCSATRLAMPFGTDWRRLWTVREHEGEQWLVHASGLAVTPVYGVVEEDGTKGWTLDVQPGDAFELDYEMRRRVGQKAWERVHAQGWALCVEMGYVAPPGETVH